jgi:hypothetical protein
MPTSVNPASHDKDAAAERPKEAAISESVFDPASPLLRSSFAADAELLTCGDAQVQELEPLAGGIRVGVGEGEVRVETPPSVLRRLASEHASPAAARFRPLFETLEERDSKGMMLGANIADVAFGHGHTAITPLVPPSALHGELIVDDPLSHAARDGQQLLSLSSRISRLNRTMGDLFPPSNADEKVARPQAFDVVPGSSPDPETNTRDRLKQD